MAVQPQHDTVPSAERAQFVLSPLVMYTCPGDGGVPWPSPQHIVAPAAVMAHVDTYCG